MTNSCGPRSIPPLYTPEQRRRRDASRWTIVQGVLAPLQFLVFAVSLALVVTFMVTGDYFEAATTITVKSSGWLSNSRKS